MPYLVQITVPSAEDLSLESGPQTTTQTSLTGQASSVFNTTINVTADGILTIASTVNITNISDPTSGALQVMYDPSHVSVHTCVT